MLVISQKECMLPDKGRHLPEHDLQERKPSRQQPGIQVARTSGGRAWTCCQLYAGQQLVHALL